MKRKIFSFWRRLAFLVFGAFLFLTNCSNFSESSQSSDYLQILQALGANEYEKVILLSQQMIATDSSFTPAFEKLAQGYFRSEQLGKGIEYFDFLKIKQPQNANIYIALGICFKYKDDHEAAVNYFQEAIRLSPSNSIAFAQLIKIYSDTKNLSEAFEQLQAMEAQYINQAAFHYAMGYMYYETESYWEECREELTRAIELDSILLDSYRLLGNSYILTREDSLALPVFERALKIAKSRNDYEFQNTFEGSIAIVYNRMGKTQLALKEFFKTAESAKRIGFISNEGAVYGNIATIYKTENNFSEAIKYHQKAIDCFRLANSTVGEGNQFNNLGSIYYRQGKNEKAVDHYEKALVLFKKANKPISIISPLMNMAIIFHINGEYQRALDSNQVAINLAELTGSYYDLATILGNRATIYFDMGDSASAFRDNAKALDIYTAMKDTLQIIKMIYNRGVNYHELGMYSKAMKQAQAALTLAKQWNKSPQQTAISTNIVGVVFGDLGEQRTAIPFFREALRLSVATNDTLIQVQALGNLGLMYLRLEKPDSALSYYQQSLQLLKQRNERELLSQLYGNVALVFVDLKQYSAALDSAKLGLNLAEELRNPARIGFCYQVLGLINYKLGNYEKSIEMLQRSVELHTKIGAQIGIWESNIIWGDVFAATGNLSQAKQKYDQAISALEYVRGAVLNANQRSEFFKDKLEVYIKMISLLHKINKDDPAALSRESFYYAEKSKTRTLKDMMEQNFSAGTVKSIDPEMRRNFIIITNQIDAKYNLIHNELEQDQSDTQHIEKLKKDIEALRSRRDSINILLAANLPAELSIEEIQKTILKPDQVLVEYLVGKENSYVWVISSDSHNVHSLDLSRKEIAALLGSVSPLFLTEHDTTHRDLPQRSAITDYSNAKFSYEALSVLYDSLLKPVESYFADSSEILIVPSDILFYFPFEILICEKNGRSGRHLIEKYPVSYATSASFVSKKSQPLQRPSGGILAFGDPEIKPGENQKQLARLANSKIEVENIKARFPDIKVFLGSMATEAVLKARAGNHQIIHLAVHGFANDQEPFMSGIALVSTPKPPEDGDVFAYEIMEMNIPAEMVVLSSCESAIGKLQEGEGLLSLTRSFFLAGAQSTVSSLWKVNDVSTADFMTNFYENLKNGESRSRALQAAKISMIKGGGNNNPYFWAPFILYGNNGKIQFKEPATAVRN